MNYEVKTFTMELAGRTLTAEIGRVAEQANGAVLLYYGDTVVLSTATASEKPREGIDFFPLSIEYEEKLYSVGKIPGGFIKREGRPSENSVLTSRVIDRPMRPLFPDDYRNDVAINNLVLSVDQNASPEVTAMIGSSLAVSISDIPFHGPIASTVVGLVDGEFVFNPTKDQKEKSQMSLIVASTSDKVVMIEASANEIPEAQIIEAIYKGHEVNQQVVAFINEIVAACGKEKKTYTSAALPSEVYDAIVSIITPAAMEVAVFTDEKQVREGNLKILSEKVEAEFAVTNPEWISFIPDAMYKFQKKTVRKMILKDQKRPDGRKLDELRFLSAEVDILPRTHGSAIFRRGQTQVLTVTTLGPLAEMQRLDGLDELEESKVYMHHYNFPSYSVGETRPSRGPGRREIGHGALAEKAIVPVLPSQEDFPYAIRTVSEILSSNGSTSQGSICASSLSLMAAGVPLKRPVAGISCGLVTGDTDDDYVILTDIQGLEDFFGDMDFKVAGTKDGITAIQMDIKVEGLTREIVEKAIYDTQKSRYHILDNIMIPAIPVVRPEVSFYAPKIVQTKVNPEKISEIIGQRGKTINKIIEETGVKIDIEDDGRIFVCSTDMASINRALSIIDSIIRDIEEGQIFEGKVVRIMAFGAFVELAPGKDGLLHISKLSTKRVEKVEEVVNIGDVVKVKVLEVDKQGRINLGLITE